MTLGSLRFSVQISEIEKQIHDPVSLQGCWGYRIKYVNTEGTEQMSCYNLRLQLKAVKSQTSVYPNIITLEATKLVMK